MKLVVKLEEKSYKLGAGDRDWGAHAYSNEFYLEPISGGGDRLIIGASSNHIDLLIELLEPLKEPFGILYVLVVSRVGHEDGRYQIESPMSRNELYSFLKQFEGYFEFDGRHAIWIMSLPDTVTLVYEQHNLIYFYGEHEAARNSLKSKGFSKREFRIPSPHSHNYNEEYDRFEDQIFESFGWIHFPLVEDVDDP